MKEGSIVWERLSKILPERLEALGLGRGLTASEVCAEFDRLAREMVAPDAPIRAISYKDGRLKVEVTGGIWATELRLRLPKLKRELVERLRETEITEIKLQVR